MTIDTVTAASNLILSTDDSESSVPRVYFDKITLDKPTPTSNSGGVTPYELFVNLQLHLEIPLVSGLFTSDDDFLEHLNVVIFRTTDPDVTISLETGAHAALDNGFHDIDVVYDDLLLNLSKGTDVVRFDSSPVFETDTGKNVITVAFQVQDTNLDPASETNLFYYAYCYLDLNGLASSLGISSSGPLKLNGPISGEKIIENGKINTTSFVYIVTSDVPKGIRGTYWTGPVVYNPTDGTFVSGRYTKKINPSGTSTALSAYYAEDLVLIEVSPRIYVDQIVVRNSKIQDFRIVGEFASLNVDLDPSKFNPITIKGRDTFNNSFNPPDAYVSNAFLSRDMHNNCRFMFEFDYGKFIIQESKFGKILTNPFVPEATKNKIYLYSRITSMEIVRRQVETARSINRLSSPSLGISQSDLNREIKIIVKTASNGSQNLLDSITMYDPGGSNAKSGDPIGSIKELPMIKHSPVNTRTIMVTDNSVSQLTDGTYQYGINMEMEDGTVRFLNERLKRLKTIRDYLVGFYNILQVPKKSFLFGSNKNITEYYTKLFASRIDPSAEDEFAKNREIDLASSIEDLRFELGIAVGTLGNAAESNPLYPWKVAPEYYVDTMEAISDFSTVKQTPVSEIVMDNNRRFESTFVSNGKFGEFGESLLPQGPPSGLFGQGLGSPYGSRSATGTPNFINGAVPSSKNLTPFGQTTGTSKGGDPNKRLTLNLANRALSSASGQSRAIGKYISKNLNVEKTKFIDLFDEDAAKYSLSTLLDPINATPESVMVVIGMFDNLEQKIRSMMGSSAEIDTAPAAVKRFGVSKNSKVSILNLKDYFAEIFDVQLSQMPAGDRIGFVGSAGYIPPTSGGDTALSFADGAKVAAFSGPSPKLPAQDKVSGILGLTGREWLMRLADETALYDEAGLAALAGLRNTKLDSGSSEAMKIEFKEKLKQLQSGREAEREISRKGLPSSEKNRPVNNKKGTYLSLAVLNDKNGTEFERPSKIDKAWDPLQYTKMQNTMGAIATGDFKPTSGVTTNQDAINHIMNKMGVTVQPTKTPFAPAISLAKFSQSKATPFTEISSILGSADLQSGAKKGAVADSCAAPGSQYDDEMCKTETSAMPVTQLLTNEVIAGGYLNQVKGKINGNPTTQAKMFNNNPISSLFNTSGGKSPPAQFKNFMNLVEDGLTDPSSGFNLYPMRKFSIEDLARVEIFKGYDTDAEGNIIIKKPNFDEVPEDDWRQIIKDLEKTSTPYEAILCKFVNESSADQINDGLNIVYTNTYFLIERSETSRFEFKPIVPGYLAGPAVPGKGSPDGKLALIRPSDGKKPGGFGPDISTKAALPPGVGEFGIPWVAQQSTNPQKGSGKLGTNTTVVK